MVPPEAGQWLIQDAGCSRFMDIVQVRRNCGTAVKQAREEDTISVPLNVGLDTLIVPPDGVP